MTTVVSDRKVPYFHSSTGDLVYFSPDIASAQDYYPFGSIMPGRSFSSGYRYGFQGQEQDDEVKGTGNSVNYKYRVHDPRLGRFLSIDPLIQKYPELSPYQFAANIPIASPDYEGLESPFYDAKVHSKNRAYQQSVLNSGDAAAIKKMRQEEAIGMLGAASLMTIAFAGPAILEGGVVSAGYWVLANPIKTVYVGGTVASALDPNPVADYTPGLPGDEAIGNMLGEFGRLLKSEVPKLILGKAHVIGRYAESAKNAAHMFKPGMGLGIPDVYSLSNKIMMAMYKTVDDGHKILLDLTDVSKNLAKQGFKNFDEAADAGKITEWELSKILRDKELLENTTFILKGETKKASEVGLELITE